MRINPSNTGNIRVQGNFKLTDSLRFTIDPSWQYVKANGGGTTVVNENDARLAAGDAPAGNEAARHVASLREGENLPHLGGADGVFLGDGI
ncbi:MAG: hypothetical protein HC783_17330, partial [Rhodobacteraceae bacterium]|nr:hypothetical protein [Paracoccaceae bacterium]